MVYETYFMVIYHTYTVIQNYIIFTCERVVRDRIHPISRWFSLRAAATDSAQRLLENFDCSSPWIGLANALVEADYRTAFYDRTKTGTLTLRWYRSLYYLGCLCPKYHPYKDKKFRYCTKMPHSCRIFLKFSLRRSYQSIRIYLFSYLNYLSNQMFYI